MWSRQRDWPEFHATRFPRKKKRSPTSRQKTKTIVGTIDTPPPTPRPVFITGGTMDQHTDAKGMFLAGALASPVYELLGKKGLGTTEMPPADTALITGDIGYRMHTGGHTPTRPDNVHRVLRKISQGPAREKITGAAKPTKFRPACDTAVAGRLF